MSTFGKYDSKQLTGNISVTQGSASVTNALGNVTTFLNEVAPGDYIALGPIQQGAKYWVKAIVSNTLITLGNVWGGASANGLANVQQGPSSIKKVANVGTHTGNLYGIQEIYGVDFVEASSTPNKRRGVSSPGWVKIHTYPDAWGGTRTRTETLVASSKYFNRDLTTGNLAVDALDDALLTDGYVWFPSQTGNTTFTVSNANLATSITITPTVEPASYFTVTYKWQVGPNNATFTDVPNTGIYSGNTTTTLSFANVLNMKGNCYRLVATATGNGLTTLSNTSFTANIFY